MTKEMTKTLYEVHRNGNLIVKYVTHTKNCEVMLREIIDLHHRQNDDVFYPSNLRVVRVIGKERKVIYTPKLREFWITKQEFETI